MNEQTCCPLVREGKGKALIDKGLTSSAACLVGIQDGVRELASSQ